MIWGPLEPYVLYIKIAAVAVVLAGAATLGWTARGWKCDAALTQSMRAAAEATQEDIDEYKRNSAINESFNAKQRADYMKERATLRAKNTALEEEIKNAPLNTIAPRDGESLSSDEPFNREFLRLWNEPIRTANKTLRDPQDGPGVLGGDTTAARVTREDVLQDHRKIVELFSDCKVKQDYVLEFDKQYRPYMGGK
jgi:hypothetical protein